MTLRERLGHVVNLETDWQYTLNKAAHNVTLAYFARRGFDRVTSPWLTTLFVVLTYLVLSKVTWWSAHPQDEIGAKPHEALDVVYDLVVGAVAFVPLFAELWACGLAFFAWVTLVWVLQNNAFEQ